ncbi:MAG: hypothetical protein ACREFP_09940 [Acetobacteraceae bacterium]
MNAAGNTSIIGFPHSELASRESSAVSTSSPGSVRTRMPRESNTAQRCSTNGRCYLRKGARLSKDFGKRSALESIRGVPLAAQKCVLLVSDERY